MDAIDIYWITEPKPNTFSNVIIFNENEHGHAGYIAMKGLVKGLSPIGYVVSHLIANLVFNQTSEPHEIGWEIYHTGDTLIVNINEWPPTALYPIEESRATWIYIYPVVRDLLKQLKGMGASHLWSASSLAVHEALEPDEFPQLSETEYLTYNLKNATKTHISNEPWEHNIFFTPPTWLFPYFAHKMGWETCKSVLCGYNPEETINAKAGVTMADYFNMTLGMDFSTDEMKKAGDIMQAHSDRADNMQKEMDDLIKGKPANNTMWG